MDGVLVDSAEAALERGVATIDKNLGRMVKKEKISEADAAAALGRISRSTRISDVSDQGLVVEAVVERSDVKAAIFSELDSVAARSASARRKPGVT